MFLWHVLKPQVRREKPRARVHPSVENESEVGRVEETLEHANSFRIDTSIGKSMVQYENIRQESPALVLSNCDIVPNANIAIGFGGLKRKTGDASRLPDIMKADSDGALLDEDVGSKHEFLSPESIPDHELIENSNTIHRSTSSFSERSALGFGAAGYENSCSYQNCPSANNGDNENQSTVHSPVEDIVNILLSRDEGLQQESSMTTASWMRQAHKGNSISVNGFRHPTEITDPSEIGIGDSTVRIWNAGGDMLLEFGFEEAQSMTMADLKQRLSTDLGEPYENLVLTYASEMDLSENRTVRPLKFLRSFDLWLLVRPVRHLMQITTPTRMREKDSENAVDSSVWPTPRDNRDAGMEDASERNTFDEEGSERDTCKRNTLDEEDSERDTYQHSRFDEEGFERDANFLMGVSRLDS